MFEELQVFDESLLDRAVHELHNDRIFLVIVDADVYCMFQPQPNFKLNSSCVKKGLKKDSYVVQDLTPMQYSVITTWIKGTTRALCQRWKEVAKDQVEILLFDVSQNEARASFVTHGRPNCSFTSGCDKIAVIAALYKDQGGDIRRTAACAEHREAFAKVASDLDEQEAH